MFFYHRQYCRVCPYQANAYNNIYIIKYCTRQADKISAILCKIPSCNLMQGGVVYRQRSKKHKNRVARQGGNKSYDNEYTRLFHHHGNDDSGTCFPRAFGVDCGENKQKVNL